MNTTLCRDDIRADALRAANAVAEGNDGARDLAYTDLANYDQTDINEAFAAIVVQLAALAAPTMFCEQFATAENVLMAMRFMDRENLRLVAPNPDGTPEAGGLTWLQAARAKYADVTVDELMTDLRNAVDRFVKQTGNDLIAKVFVGRAIEDVRRKN
jgi:hypothetical protein